MSALYRLNRRSDKKRRSNIKMPSPMRHGQQRHAGGKRKNKTYLKEKSTHNKSTKAVAIVFLLFLHLSFSLSFSVHLSLSGTKAIISPDRQNPLRRLQVAVISRILVIDHPKTLETAFPSLLPSYLTFSSEKHYVRTHASGRTVHAPTYTL